MALGQAGTPLERMEDINFWLSHLDEEEVFVMAPAVLTDLMRLLTIAETASNSVENL